MAEKQKEEEMKKAFKAYNRELNPTCSESTSKYLLWGHSKKNQEPIFRKCKDNSLCKVTDEGEYVELKRGDADAKYYRQWKKNPSKYIESDAPADPFTPM